MENSLQRRGKESMIRKVCTALSVVLISVVFLHSIYADDPVKNKKKIFNEYKAIANKAKNINGVCQFAVQHQYMGKFPNQMEILFELVYSLPVEDPVYRDNSELYFRTFALLDWQIALNNRRLEGTRKINSVYSDLYTSHPLIKNTSHVSIKNVSTSIDMEFRFAVDPVSPKAPQPMLDMYIPPELYAWHYLPDLWYPNPELFGFPKDVDSVKTQRVEGLISFNYTPESIEKSLLAYLQKCAKDPTLSPSDLFIYFSISPDTKHCPSLIIKTEVNGKDQILFSITNSKVTPSINGFALPTRTVLYTNAAADDAKEYWGPNYFGTFFLKGFERTN
jgi:hypothetical protein